MARRKNTAQAYEILVRIAQEREADAANSDASSSASSSEAQARRSADLLAELAAGSDAPLDAPFDGAARSDAAVSASVDETGAPAKRKRRFWQRKRSQEAKRSGAGDRSLDPETDRQTQMPGAGSLSSAGPLSSERPLGGRAANAKLEAGATSGSRIPLEAWPEPKPSGGGADRLMSEESGEPLGRSSARSPVAPRSSQQSLANSEGQLWSDRVGQGSGPRSTRPRGLPERAAQDAPLAESSSLSDRVPAFRPNPPTRWLRRVEVAEHENAGLNEAGRDDAELAAEVDAPQSSGVPLPLPAMPPAATRDAPEQAGELTAEERDFLLTDFGASEGVAPEPVYADAAVASEMVSSEAVGAEVGSLEHSGEAFAELVPGGGAGAAPEEPERPERGSDGADGSSGDHGESRSGRRRGGKSEKAADGAGPKRFARPHPAGASETEGSTSGLSVDSAADPEGDEEQEASPSLSRQLVLSPWTAMRWLFGDSGTEFLGRRVEFRMSTLIMSTLSLVIALALVGISINLSLQPKEDGAEAYLEKYGTFDSPNLAQNPPNGGRLDSDVSGDAGNGGEDDSAGLLASQDSAALDRPVLLEAYNAPLGKGGVTGPTWRGEPDRRLGSEFRSVSDGRRPAPSASPSLEHSTENWWLCLRGLMDDGETQKLEEHMTGLVIPHFGLSVRLDRSEQSVAHKEIVSVPMSTRPGLYQVYLGPFESKRDADAAKSAFSAELSRNAKLRYRNYFGDVFAYRESQSISTARRAAHASGS